MTLTEIIDAAAVAEGPSITLDQLVAEHFGTNPRTRYTADFRAARSAVPDGWGIHVEHIPPRVPYAEVYGPRRIGSTGATLEIALLAAGLRAHHYIQASEIVRQREIAAHQARQPKPAAVASEEPEGGTVTIIAGDAP